MNAGIPGAFMAHFVPHLDPKSKLYFLTSFVANVGHF
jgi:hypothetical protein